MDENGRPKPFVVAMDDLRQMLGIRPHEYPKYSHFRSRVLDSAAQQLDLHTSVSFTYRAVRRSRAVVAFRFTAVSKNTSKSAKTTEPAFNGKVAFAEFKKSFATPSEQVAQIKEETPAQNIAPRPPPAPLAAAQEMVVQRRKDYAQFRANGGGDPADHKAHLAGMKQASAHFEQLLLEYFPPKAGEE